MPSTRARGFPECFCPRAIRAAKPVFARTAFFNSLQSDKRTLTSQRDLVLLAFSLSFVAIHATKLAHTLSSQRPCCAICARAVILPNVVPPTQFIICTICETKMISANAAAGSSKQPPQRHTGTSQSSSRAPSATPSASSSSSSGLKIRLPGSRKVASQAKQAPSPIAAVEVQNPSLKVKIPSKRKASSSSAPMGPPADIPALLSRFATTEKTIEALTNKPHFNEKGELIEYAVSLLSSASASPQKPVSTTPSMRISSLTRPIHRLPQQNLY